MMTRKTINLTEIVSDVGGGQGCQGKNMTKTVDHVLDAQVGSWSIERKHAPKLGGHTMNERYWLFNTDETEQEGEGAYRHMLDLSAIAAWGHCRGTGARRTLDKPAEGETVYFFRAGHGIIASGQVAGQAFKATTVFNQPDEYHRTVSNLRVSPRPLTIAEIREKSSYELPCRHIVCQLNDADGVRLLVEHFKNLPVT
jgi:hypothetical protein